MSNAIQNDYFSFMSDRRENAAAKRRTPAGAPAAKPVKHSDTIDFVDFVEKIPGIEVVESVASDTLIERVRARWSER